MTEIHLYRFCLLIYGLNTFTKGKCEKLLGRAVVQAVSSWHLAAEARVRAGVNPRGIFGG
jgi:hypothetical protein